MGLLSSVRVLAELTEGAGRRPIALEHLDLVVARVADEETLITSSATARAEVELHRIVDAVVVAAADLAQIGAVRPVHLDTAVAVVHDVQLALPVRDERGRIVELSGVHAELADLPDQRAVRRRRRTQWAAGQNLEHVSRLIEDQVGLADAVDAGNFGVPPPPPLPPPPHPICHRVAAASPPAEVFRKLRRVHIVIPPILGRRDGTGTA